MTDEELNIALQVPKADRVFAVRAAFKKGYSVDTVYELLPSFGFTAH